MSGFNHRILVVDDEAAIRAAAEALLSAQGYEVITAADGFDGLVQLRRSLPDIVISDLSYSYPGASRRALARVNLTIPAGAAVGIVGPSGAGKSTLVDILLSVPDGHQGSIAVNGRPPSTESRIAWAPQLEGSSHEAGRTHPGSRSIGTRSPEASQIG